MTRSLAVIAGLLASSVAAGSALTRAQRSGRNRPALADESGLEIDAVPEG